jgi:hypothetical protein
MDSLSWEPADPEVALAVRTIAIGQRRPFCDWNHRVGLGGSIAMWPGTWMPVTLRLDSHEEACSTTT